MKKASALLAGLVISAIAAGIGIILFRDDTGTTVLAEVTRVTNAMSPKMVDDSIRLENAQLAAKKITFTYTMLSLRMSEIDREAWERQIQPKIERDFERAEAQEAKGLPIEGTTVAYRYLDREGHLITEVVVTINGEYCELPRKA